MSPKRTTPPFSYGLIIGIVLFLFSAVGCTGQNEIITANTTQATTLTATLVPASATPTASTTPTLTATVTPLPNLTPTLTATTTHSPFPTSTPTPLPTLTPLPTIPPEQRGQTYADLMSNNGGCELPCWWGFEMGVTSLDEVRQYYETFDAYINESNEKMENEDISVLTATFVDPQIEVGIQVRHIFIAQNGIIIEAEIEAEIEVGYDPNYRIESLLQRLGQPSEIWIWTIPDTYESVLPVALRVFFPEKGVLIGYAVFAERVGNMVQVCFNDQGGTRFLLWNPLLWNPDGDKGIVERVKNSTFTLEDSHPIEEVSNWDVEQFYTVLSNPSHTECLETPASLWPSP